MVEKGRKRTHKVAKDCYTFQAQSPLNLLRAYVLACLCVYVSVCVCVCVCVCLRAHIHMKNMWVSQRFELKHTLSRQIKKSLFKNARAPKGGLFVVVGFGLLSSCVQRRNNTKKKSDILTVKIKLAPRNSMPLISRK